MTPATWPRAERSQTRMLHLDPRRGGFDDRTVAELPEILHPGDVVIVNDAATVPASLPGRTRFGFVEMRLAGPGHEPRRWKAVVFGAGSWRQRTEDRAVPPLLDAGESIEFTGGLRARVIAVSQLSSRLVDLEFDRDGAALWSALYRAGRPVQYSHLAAPLELWHVQTTYAGRPWAVEMPSAGWAVTPDLVASLRRRGIAVVAITHAAGLSATGDEELDAALPLPERYEIPTPTADVIARARIRGGRIVAIGTSVVRALESAAQDLAEVRCGVGALRALSRSSGVVNVTELRIAPGFVPQVVDGLLTGIHTTETSHFALMGAFMTASTLQRAMQYAEDSGYLGHEFGDTCLVLGTSSNASRATTASTRSVRDVAPGAPTLTTA